MTGGDVSSGAKIMALQTAEHGRIGGVYPSANRCHAGTTRMDTTAELLYNAVKCRPAPRPRVVTRDR